MSTTTRNAARQTQIRRIPFGRLWWIALAVLFFGFDARAQPVFSDTLGGDWDGARKRLLEAGLRLEAAYTGEIARNGCGGLRRGNTQFGEIDFKLTADGEKIFSAPGLTAFAHVLGTHGGNPAELVGDAQGVSSISAPARWRVFEAWIEQNFPLQRMSL